MKVQDVLLSVGLVTRNRPASLRRTLDSLRKQSMQPAEVIVSDDSDSDFRDEVKAICHDFRATYLEGPRRGLYANRNHVLTACSGTHLRTMDDDHEFPANHFAECMSAIERDPEAIWIIGEVMPGQTPNGNSPVCPGQLHPRGFSVTPPDPQRCWAIADGASIYPRRVFMSGIGFSESFRFGAAYLEFGSLLYALGYRIRFMDTTYVVHHLDLHNRSYMDGAMELSARLFAGLCHSFIYDPTLKNKTLCALELIRRTALTGRRGILIRKAAIDAFVARQKAVRPILSS